MTIIRMAYFKFWATTEQLHMLRKLSALSSINLTVICLEFRIKPRCSILVAGTK